MLYAIDASWSCSNWYCVLLCSCYICGNKTPIWIVICISSGSSCLWYNMDRSLALQIAIKCTTVKRELIRIRIARIVEARNKKVYSLSARIKVKVISQVLGQLGISEPNKSNSNWFDYICISSVQSCQLHLVGLILKGWVGGGGSPLNNGHVSVYQDVILDMHVNLQPNAGYYI